MKDKRNKTPKRMKAPKKDKAGLSGNGNQKRRHLGGEKSRFSKFTRELGELSSKYGIAIHAVGGVYFFDYPIKITYSDDYTSGDLDPKWDDE